MKIENYLNILKSIGTSVRNRLFLSLNRQSIDNKSSISHVGKDDIIYQIDKDVEDLIISGFSKNKFQHGVILIAEGLDENGKVFPIGSNRNEAKYKIIIDPIDGTRGLMYDKRSAFFLAAIAPNMGDITSTLDIEAAIMMELPTSKSYLSDSFSTIKGQGVKGWRTNLLTNVENELLPKVSKASSIYGGFAQFSRFFSPGKDIIASMEEQLISKLFPNAPDGQAFVFEDQYISTGGQFYEMLMGHDRFIIDLRGALYKKFKEKGKKSGLSCHPYDVCTAIILQEAGAIVTDLNGDPLDVKLDTTTNVDWVAFANQGIYQEVWPILREILLEYNLID